MKIFKTIKNFSATMIYLKKLFNNTLKTQIDSKLLKKNL
jgi:hypothetical protein